MHTTNEDLERRLTSTFSVRISWCVELCSTIEHAGFHIDTVEDWFWWRRNFSKASFQSSPCMPSSTDIIGEPLQNRCTSFSPDTCPWSKVSLLPTSLNQIYGLLRKKFQSLLKVLSSTRRGRMIHVPEMYSASYCDMCTSKIWIAGGITDGFTTYPARDEWSDSRVYRTGTDLDIVRVARRVLNIVNLVRSRTRSRRFEPPPGLGLNSFSPRFGMTGLAEDGPSFYITPFICWKRGFCPV